MLPIRPDAGRDLHDRSDQRAAGGDPCVRAHVAVTGELRDLALQKDAEDRAPHGLDAEPERADPGRVARSPRVHA